MTEYNFPSIPCWFPDPTDPTGWDRATSTNVLVKAAPSASAAPVVMRAMGTGATLGSTIMTTPTAETPLAVQDVSTVYIQRSEGSSKFIPWESYESRGQALLLMQQMAAANTNLLSRLSIAETDAAQAKADAAEALANATGVSQALLDQKINAHALPNTVTMVQLANGDWPVMPPRSSQLAVHWLAWSDRTRPPSKTQHGVVAGDILYGIEASALVL